MQLDREKGANSTIPFKPSGNWKNRITENNYINEKSISPMRDAFFVNLLVLLLSFLLRLLELCCEPL